MKQLSEEMQMKIFDLLEGNLTEEEKKAVLKEIESSELLAKEYRLMAHTYLKQEGENTIVFPLKSKLYKPGAAAVIPLWRRKYFAAAASVALLAATGLSWYYLSVRDIQNNTTPIAHNRNIPAPKTEKINPFESGQFNTQNKDSKLQNQKSHSFWVLKHGDSKSEKGQNIIVNKDTTTFSRQLIAPKSPSNNLRDMYLANLGDAISPKIKPTDSALVLAPSGPISISKKRSLSYKLLHNGKTMLANLQLPEIKFTTEKKDNKNIPTVRMEIRTYRTDVIATLIE